MGGLAHAMLRASDFAAGCAGQPVLFRWWSSPADIMAFSMDTTDFGIPCMAAPARVRPFRDYYTFAEHDRTEYALAHTNIRHTQDSDCAPPALLGLCIDPVVLSGTRGEHRYDVDQGCGIRSKHDDDNTPAAALRIWQLASNGTLFQQIYTVASADDGQRTIAGAAASPEEKEKEPANTASIITVDAWPRDDPSVHWIEYRKRAKLAKMQDMLADLPRAIDAFAGDTSESMAAADALPLSMLERSIARVTREISHMMTLHELLGRVNDEMAVKVKRDMLWNAASSMSAEDVDFVLAKVAPLPPITGIDAGASSALPPSWTCSKDQLRRRMHEAFRTDRDISPASPTSLAARIIERVVDEIWLAMHTLRHPTTKMKGNAADEQPLSQEAAEDVPAWSSPFYSTQSQEDIGTEQLMDRATKHGAGSRKADRAASFEFQFLRPAITDACRYRMERQHRPPQLLNEASQVLLREWQPSGRPSAASLFAEDAARHVHRQQQQQQQAMSRGTPSRSQPVDAFAVKASTLLPTIVSSGASARAGLSSSQKVATGTSTGTTASQRTRHVAGFGKSLPASQGAAASGRAPLMKVKPERQFASQPVM
ncbi:hypothetical protein SYNPS1DRAFT_30019 [Syncephalis pseudoplumigaleata]|uniref:Uncharacterized protein n=1 Tax=Syncephalis pseudoplumigaleata TaxID=1712513 RepID=A0A4P9YWB9_9FUNG|nr:hypothetical protein SYNPS1DRAFT_30019 [Syncephalis pseudoplumigaleata]|eukprot:RKP24214.1 hypothetical protein SYNPS1DRAFT_30019 [Syncephalis pseudoplumigaleata]